MVVDRATAAGTTTAAGLTTAATATAVMAVLTTVTIVATNSRCVTVRPQPAALARDVPSLALRVSGAPLRTVITDRGKSVHINSKVAIRMKKWLLYIVPS